MTQTPPPYGPPEPGAYAAPVAYGAPNPYGAPAYGAYAPDHPQATLALILGIVGLVVCGLAAPFAWVVGGRVVRDIDASGGRLGGRSTANAGRILGIVGTVLVVLALLFVIGLMVLVISTASTSGT